jgi:hypothetical protein
MWGGSGVPYLQGNPWGGAGYPGLPNGSDMGGYV